MNEKEKALFHQLTTLTVMEFSNLSVLEQMNLVQFLLEKNSFAFDRLRDAVKIVESARKS